MRTDYDLLVIGGGPAGAIAARTAAQAGHSVLLVEKRPAIGAPVRCAEGIGKEALAEFVTPDERWIAVELKRAEIVAPDGATMMLEAAMAGSKIGYIIDRKVFDRELVWKAAEAGADVHPHSPEFDLRRRLRPCRSLPRRIGRPRRKRLLHGSARADRQGGHRGAVAPLDYRSSSLCRRHANQSVTS